MNERNNVTKTYPPVGRWQALLGLGSASASTARLRLAPLPISCTSSTPFCAAMPRIMNSRSAVPVFLNACGSLSWSGTASPL